MSAVEQLISGWRERFETALDAALPAPSAPPQRLHEAMRYSALAEGKRMRPLLTYASGRALGIEENRLDAIACAVECIHAYSLIHDDLPAMDDDDLRRGRATCHRAFDEATAILAGDSLQALSFQLVAECDESPEVKAELARTLGLACGSRGMAGGQMFDLAAVGRQLDVDELEEMHRMKTGALIQFSVTAPGVLSHADPSVLQSLVQFGDSIGLAFQIHDDILDVTGETAAIGKSSQSDAARLKPNFPSTIGLESSQARAQELLGQAKSALACIEGDTQALTHLAEFVVHREH